MPKPTTITALVIPAELSQPLHKTELRPADLPAYQRLVGGDVQVVDFAGPPACLYLNEEGKIHRLVFNARATAMTWVHNSTFRGHDTIVGDAFLLGPIDGNGDDTTVPELYLQMMFDATLLGVEVQTGGDDTWRPLDVALTAQSSAYLLVADFAHRTPEIDEIRLTVIDNPQAWELIARSSAALTTAFAALDTAAAPQ